MCTCYLSLLCYVLFRVKTGADTREARSFSARFFCGRSFEFFLFQFVVVVACHYFHCISSTRSAPRITRNYPNDLLNFTTLRVKLIHRLWLKHNQAALTEWKFWFLASSITVFFIAHAHWGADMCVRGRER